MARWRQYLAETAVQIWKFITRPNGSGTPACVKPQGRNRQCGGDSAADSRK
ncbi:MAG: hypothetical protein FWC10_07435 [Lentimicrobiaceae bacterium]|nr:hypothetical protein [Lentimicrobiaceae bacterium]